MTPGPELLSARERDVLRLLARGHTNREVAERLHLSVRTVEWHRASIQRKLNITSRAGLVDFAAAHGLVRFGA
jgi:two-component system, NarL family, response regulator NreC